MGALVVVCLALVVGVAGADAAGAAGDTDSAATVRPDPASDRLRYVIIGLVGLSGVLLVGTARFWWATRPDLVASPPEPTDGHRRSASRGTGDRIPASVVLAGPLTAPPIVTTPPGAHLAGFGNTAVADGAASTDGAATDDAAADDLADIPPPVGEPALLAAPPPPEVEQPLVGPDSAWIIDDEATPVPDSPEPDAFAVATIVDPAATERPPVAPAATSLIAALAALPDHDGPRVDFGDPPVQRAQRAQQVQRPPATPSAPPASPAEPPEAPAASAPPEPAHEHEPEPEPEREPVVHLPVEEPRVELVDLPPVGVFYDQDLDPGEPPGRVR